MDILEHEPLVSYFKNQKQEIDDIFPEEITWENAENYNFSLDIKHPDWLKKMFPLKLIYYRPKAGKLRDSTSLKVMDQNNFNILIQNIRNENDFGLYHRKHKHKGFNNIIAAFSATDDDFKSIYGDKERSRKVKNFEELSNIFQNKSTEVLSFLDYLKENYPCDSIGQMKLF